MVGMVTSPTSSFLHAPDDDKARIFSNIDNPLQFDLSLTIERGGQLYRLARSNQFFAVKKKMADSHGTLRISNLYPTEFHGLRFHESSSPVGSSKIEVYSVATDALESAMHHIRTQSRDVDWCAHVYTDPFDTNSLLVPNNAIYTRFKADYESAGINALLQQHRLELVRLPEQDDPELDELAAMLYLTKGSAENPIKIANHLRRNPAVLCAEPDFYVHVRLKSYFPKDTLFPRQWHLHNPGGVGLTVGADINAPEAWDITRGRTDVVVCIIDDAIDINHPDLNAPDKVRAPFNFKQNNADPTPQGIGENHGTHCAGVAVAAENGIGTVGVAPACPLMPLRMSYMLNDESVRRMFEYAAQNGASVISCSWGADLPYFPISTNIQNVLSRVASQGRNGKGCILLFAAGNENAPVNGTKIEDNGVQQRYLNGFACHPDVIAVSASNSHDIRSDYSNYGAEIWVCAPSSGSGGQRIVTTDRVGSAGDEGGDYTVQNGFGGTSSATPLVAGVCALILSCNPELSSAQVKQILRQSADKIDPIHGNYDANGHSDWYGYGRVNAAKALLLAEQLKPSSQVQSVRRQRSPRLTVPDNQPNGIYDTVAIDTPGSLQDIGVRVAINHPFRGDLVVKLRHPNGQEVLLHNKSGGGQANLNQLYTVQTTPALQGMIGKPVAGNWQLAVADVFPPDGGVLQEWELILQVLNPLAAALPSTTIVPSPETWATTPNLTIPDNDLVGVHSELYVPLSGTVRDVQVTVNIRHPRCSDLLVELEAPNGLRVPLHTGAGGNIPDLRKVYTPQNRPPLQMLLRAKTERQGTWKLLVRDRNTGQTGILENWRLRLLVF
jgi:subtilisin-like proprotein convertase family protein